MELEMLLTFKCQFPEVERLWTVVGDSKESLTAVLTPFDS